MSSVNSDGFSIRWTGKIKALGAGTYSFATRTDDGVRLWLGNTTGTPQINQWINQGATTYSTNYTLSAGQQIDFKMEYFENTSPAEARLLWKPPGASTHVAIPQAQLAP